MYPYTRGASLLSMATLPPEYSALPAEEAAARLTEEGERARLRESWFPQVALKPSLGPGWPRMIALSAMPAAGWEWCPGLTIEQIARRLGTDEVDATLSLLIASGMQASAVMAVRRERPLDELGRLFRHASHTGGSDGIFIGAVPHPRAHGAFARYLATMIGDWWTWESAAAHLSGLPASRFGLGRRGAARPGWRADLCIVDPADVADRATYAEPRRLATGIDEVLVAGVPVLRDGELTGARSGRGLRRTAG
jgi:N-acyl-D-amino-acid deacylase